MRCLHFARHAVRALLFCLLVGAAHAAEPISGTLVDKVSGIVDKKTIESLFIDSSAGSVSAASLAGADGDPTTVVENVKDFSVLLGALDASTPGFGIAITPARTKFPFPSINLHEYKDSRWLQLLGALTFAYAQSKEAIDGVDYRRQAVSVATSGYFRSSDDPVVVVARAVDPASDGKTSCARVAFSQIELDGPGTDLTQPEIDRLVQLARLERDAANKDPAAADKAAAAQREIEAIEAKARAGDKTAILEAEYIQKQKALRLAPQGSAARARLLQGSRLPAEQEKAALDAFNTCVDAALKKHAEKWNRSRYSISYATGSIKPTDGSTSSTGLGQTLALSVLYGFDGVKYLDERAAITLTVRRNDNEPILETLGGTVREKDSTLAAIRLSGGSSVFRGLIELNNAKDDEVTSMQRTMRRAIGVDFRIMEGLWLNLRYGKQRKVDGTGDESSSFLVLNYGGMATLGR